MLVLVLLIPSIGFLNSSSRLRQHPEQWSQKKCATPRAPTTGQQPNGHRERAGASPPNDRARRRKRLSAQILSNPNANALPIEPCGKSGHYRRACELCDGTRSTLEKEFSLLVTLVFPWLGDRRNRRLLRNLAAEHSTASVSLVTIGRESGPKVSPEPFWRTSGESRSTIRSITAGWQENPSTSLVQIAG